MIKILSICSRFKHAHKLETAKLLVHIAGAESRLTCLDNFQVCALSLSLCLVYP